MLSDQVLELVFAFLREHGGGKTDEDLQLAALPVCKLLETRRMHGFDYVKLEVCRKDLQWAMRAQEYWKRAALLSQVKLASPTLLPPGQPSDRDPSNGPDVVRYL